jgi:hypothetical protein
MYVQKCQPLAKENIVISRDEIRQNLTKRASIPLLVEPAMQLAEPLFRTIENGYYLSDSPKLEDTEICDAIRDVTGATTIAPKRISIKAHSKAGSLLLDQNIGEGFGAALMDASIIGAAAGRTAVPFPELQEFSPSLQAILHHVFMNSLEKRLDLVYTGSLLIRNIATAARDSVETALTCYLSLTALGKSALIKQHLRRPLLLLTRAIPLANTKQKDGTWTVLTP